MDLQSADPRGTSGCLGYDPTQDFVCRTITAGDRAVDGSRVAAEVGGFAGEEKRVSHRSGENGGRGDGADRRIAVCAQTQGVALPIRNDGGPEFALKCLL